MFQFPGFALLTLCIQVKSTCFSRIIDTRRVTITTVRWVAPFGDPWIKAYSRLPLLIAEYHVLHRLLLPRHPPNALLALDLIQKKTGFLPGSKAGNNFPGPVIRPKASHFPLFLDLVPANAEVIGPCREH
jgi:hypothetical protein